MFGFLALFIAYSHLPGAGAGTASDLVTPTAVPTHPVSTLTVNHSVDFSGVHITVTRVQEAAAFSDDSKHPKPYTVRVYVHVVNNGQAAVGIDYNSLARLLLPDGVVVMPQLVTIPPQVLPNEMQDGYLDFPVATQVALSSLALRFGSGTMVAFGG